MAYCPNPDCKRKLKFSDWRELCPDCGVNILYFGMEERMEEESDRVELAAAAAQKKFDRASAAVIGGPFAIARLALLFLPLGALAPVLLSNMRPAILDVFQNMGRFSEQLQQLNATSQRGYIIMLAGIFIAAAAALAGLFTSFLAASPKWFWRNSLISSAGMAGAALSLIAGNQLKTAFAGLFLAFALILGINLIIKAKGGVPVQYKQCIIGGLPEEEVLAYIARGGTVKELREQKALEAISIDTVPA